MADPIENLRIDKEAYVNQATLELLQKRIEGEVKANFFRSVTLPIGGGGLMAVGLAVFLWVPQKVESFLEDPSVQGMVNGRIEEQIDGYFKREETQLELAARIREQTARQIRQELNAQLPAEVGKAVTSAVRDYFVGPEGSAFVRHEVREIVDRHLAAPETQDGIRKLVDEYMQTEGQKILADKVEEVLRPVAARVGMSISRNRERTVVEFEPQSLQGTPKESLLELQEHTRPENVARIRRRGLPVVLTKSIAPRNEYDENAIRQYLDGFRQAFGDQFRYVAVSWSAEGGAERLLALIPAQQFAAVFQRQGPDIVGLLNVRRLGPAGFKADDARVQLAAWFGEQVLRQVGAEQKVETVLLDASLWNASPALDAEVAVVDSGGRLSATTTRRRLVNGLFK